MVNNIALFFLVIIVLIVSSDKIESKKNKNEKISFFLIKHELSEIVNVRRRFSKPKDIDVLDSDRSFLFTAFGNTFVVDLSIFHPRDDCAVHYISKLFNSTSTYFEYALQIYQGYVRNINHSLALGYFGKNFPFRGYIITNEIFCIEPYDSKKVIVYRFKDVITPGCAKSFKDEGLDCSEARYFLPWKAEKPPAIQHSQYSLFYDKYLEAKKSELKKGGEQKNESSTEKHQDNVHHKSHNKDEKEAKKKSETFLRYYKANKEAKFGSKTEHPEMTIATLKLKEHIKLNKNEICKLLKNKTRKKDDNNEEDFDDDCHKKESLKDSDRFTFPESTTETSRANATVSKRKIERSYNNEDLLGRKKESVEVTKKHKKQVNKRGLKSKALKSDPIESLQCNVQVIVAPSFMKKFDGDMKILMKEILIQFTLLNKIFFKLPLQRQGKTVHLTFHVETIGIFGDQVYSPFTERPDLEYFTQKSRGSKTYCLSIGLANQYLKSGEFFDGYIPKGGGGICSKVGNTLIISHGNEKTPAPMALFFSSLVRGITRAIGANDMDEECEEGSFPNPMVVLQEYLLSQEIAPSSGYSILTSCNIKEIEASLKAPNCFYRVSQPLCGNAIKDPGEECDCGPNVMCAEIDPCCNLPNLFTDPKPDEVKKGTKHKGCTLLKGAKCSYLEECCTDCHITKSKRICYSGPLECDIAECNGKSSSCPIGIEASNGMICSTNETLPEPMVCKDNVCDQHLCSSSKLEPCTCAPGTKKECVYCCVKDGKCQAAGEDLQLFPNKTFFLPDYAECMGGTCQQGKCTTEYGMQVVYTEPKQNTPQSVLISGAHFEFCCISLWGLLFLFLYCSY